MTLVESETRRISTARLLVIVALTFSLVSLTGPLSGLLQLPLVRMPSVHATNDRPIGLWTPAGAQEQTLSISQGDGPSSTPVGWLLTNQIDASDWPLTATQQGSGSGNVNCSSNTAVFCSLPVPDHGYFEIQFNLANVLWGIPMSYGNSTAGVELRQGIAHLINKQSFAANNAACLGVTCIPNDAAVPVCTTTAGCTNGGLPAANPCNWDTLFSENSSSNCVVGAPGGTAYNCAYSTVCPIGTVTGTTTFPWQAAIGSPDFCAAAQHFARAFKMQLGINVTLNVNCELLPPTGGWPPSVTAIGTASCNGFASANVCFSVRTSEPRKSLGESLAQDICALFSPAWTGGTGWTTLAGQNFTCDKNDTGTNNPACGGGSCPFLIECEGDICPFDRSWVPTSTNGTPDLVWSMFSGGGFGQVFPFDSTTYFVYNSLFATKTDYTCNNVDCSSKIPSSTCASTTYTSSASDYMYLCSPNYDSLSSQIEKGPCLSTAGDPSFGQSSPTFANCPGTSSLSSISAGYQAEDYFGSHVFTLPIWSGKDVQARLSAWPEGPGWFTAVGGGYSASASFWEWLNAYSPTPAVAGTLRQSFTATVGNLTPFQFSTLWEGYLLSNIYDTLFNQNPLCTNSPASAAGAGIPMCSSIFQNIDWMTTSHSFLCFPGGPACTPTMLGYGNSTYFANTVADLRLTLNRSNHWQDGGPVTAWDVKYSMIDLNATGAFQAGPLAAISHVNVIDEFTLDLNLKAKGPFTEFFIGGITIMPGHVWSACGASAWNSGVTGKNVAGTAVESAAEDTCVGAFGAPSIITINGVRGDSPTFDPIANNVLIGSGPYVCQSIGGAGHPAIGTIGGGCSVDNTQSPAFGLNDFTLTRTGCTLTTTGTVCGVAGSGSDYFRSSGALAAYTWTGDIGSGSADFSRVLTVNSCHSATPSANCPHWAQGIGNPSSTSTSNLVGVAQRTRVNSFKGISWIAFSTEKNTSTQLILACSAGYTLPNTSITPCSSINEGWTGTIMPGINSYATTLHEVGSQITPPGGTSSVSTSTLAPASAIGCNSDYPVGGYDC